MFTGHNSKFWDERYQESEYAYGIEPNQFLTSQINRLKPNTQALVVGDGEGRNGVWLATQGLNVHTIDLSPIGIGKAQALAHKNQVKINAECADLTNWNWLENEYDLVVSIYLHFAADVRQRMHQLMLKSLKPNGLLILEGFNLGQLQYQQEYDSGGPKIPEMLFTPDILRQDFSDGKILELTETVTDLSEGRYHNGKASVIRLVMQKAPNFKSV
ncbi:class I SAM-dependent methyltransferase [Pseudanabaena sp. UWO311]|uniref:class I SAM-dependent methyltransferase n=1 Tax=Pseudanabaena sp. UWO311 TaxID=2487337 RepID=UPI001158E5D0|nr:class I SAM-dependent methyltransferase [Pseudanabaena sp. UWO311]TYQ27797.1 class I SAM-dependent methyltransferase [Pseudanabaena sp. UWO311]